MKLEDIKKDFENILNYTKQQVSLILSDRVAKELFENIEFKQQKLKNICIVEVVNQKIIDLKITNKNIEIKKLLEFLEKTYKNYFFKINDKAIQCELLSFEENKEFSKKQAKQTTEDAKIRYRNIRQEYLNYLKKNIKSETEKKILEKNFETIFKDYNTKIEMLIK